ncbi:MAG: type II toxin-antitoxin system VapC family toxin [Proteobacteria bacterium]|nr:type II toxin-antitoxin system VapC family toxin [Pseudomonadota bacterium]
MAAVLIDTNILLDVHTQDPIWEARSATAIAAIANSAALVINSIIYAELSIGIQSIELLDEFLGTDFRRDPLPWEAAFLAGKAFLTYRRRSGSKTGPLPDFYIGAHAAVQGMKILTRDPNRYASYFPTVEILEP